MESDTEEVDVENTTSTPEAANLSFAAARRTQEPPPELEEPQNVLTLGPLRRHHLHVVLTCEASNNNITTPISLAVAIDMSRECRLACFSSFSLPPLPASPPVLQLFPW